LACTTGVVDGENSGPYYTVGLINNKAVFVEGDSTSLVNGRFAITQLVKRSSSTLLGNWSDWELDDSMPYNNNLPSEQLYDFSKNPNLGYATDHFFDQPSVTGFLQSYSVDQFEQFFMFRPTDASGNPLAGSIWTTLGTDTWNWSGSIGPTSITDYDWVWVGTPSFYCSQSITPSHQHPEFQKTHPALNEGN
jgi:hypothetical protein